jgi:hypothetical protein
MAGVVRGTSRGIAGTRRAVAASLLLLSGCGSNGAAGPAFGSGGSGNVTSSSGGLAGQGASSVGSGAQGGDIGLVVGGAPGVDSCSNQVVSVLFVIDRSGSMNCNLPPITASAACEAMSPPAKVDSTQPSKWEQIDQTLSVALGELIPKDPSIHVQAGLSYFSVDGVCGATSKPAVPVADATPAQLDLMRQSVAAQKPAGGTPIVGATMLGYRYLYQTLGVTGNAHVILITDGADSCADYYSSDPAIGPGDHVANLIATGAPEALGVGIQTWVIGAPGSEPARYTLSSLAIAGGTRRSTDCSPGTSADPTSGDCHYDMTKGDFQTALKTALDHIMAVVTCQQIR